MANALFKRYKYRCLNNLQMAITGMTTAADAEFTTAAAHNLAVGELVRVGGVSVNVGTASALNGAWLVTDNGGGGASVTFKIGQSSIGETYDANTGVATNGVDLLADTIKLALLSSAYTMDLTTLASGFYDFPGVPSSPLDAQITAPETLSGKTIGAIADDTFDANDVVFLAVPGPTAVTQMVLYVDLGADTVSPLIAYWGTVTGFPFTPGGGNVTVTWPAGGLFTL